MSEYEALAHAYDALLADGAHRRRAAYLHRLLQKERRPVDTVLDLGCGTGTVTCLLAALGYRMTGVDLSEEMLTEAARKAEPLPEDRRPLLLHQSMDCLRLIEPVDAAVSTLDALNYLTGLRAMRETLRRVYRWLRPGGPFIFDVNTPEKFLRLDGQVYLDETEDAYCVWRTEFSRGICSYYVDLFNLRPDGAWERGFEYHRQRCYTAEELTAWLRAAGFTRIRTYGDMKLRRPADGAQRIYFVCERNQN